ncbi:MAG: monofunctional biosynthetic peptidoglycan transglycosylase [Bacteroidota bacterium]
MTQSKKKSTTKSSVKSSKKKWWKKALKIISYIAASFIILSILTTILYRWVNPPITPLMVIRKIEDGSSINKKWMPLDSISPNMVTAAVGGEDANFLNHSGFDFEAIENAMEKNLSGKAVRGGSTISQQVAKNVFLWSGRSWVRKGLEVYFTMLIEVFWSKERIMEVYLNVIEMGDGVYGAEAASQKYFNKSSSKLNRNEAALITACYPNPRIYFPNKPSSTVLHKQGLILRNMSRIKRVKFD